MNCEDEKEKINNSVTVYTGEKRSEKKLPFFNGFDDFKIDYSFHKRKKSSSGAIKNSLHDGNDSNWDDKKDDLKKLIQIINHNYIDKHFYFKKLSIHDLYKIFVYSNFLTKSLILYPSLIPHFEGIIEKVKKIKKEATFPGVEGDHFVFPPLDSPPNEGHRLGASRFIQTAAFSSGPVKNERNERENASQNGAEQTAQHTAQNTTQTGEKKAFLLGIGKDARSRNSFISTELDQAENDIGKGANTRGSNTYRTRNNHKGAPTDAGNTNCDKINTGSFAKPDDTDKKFPNCNYKRQVIEQKKNTDFFPYDGPSNYAPKNVEIQNVAHNSKVNVKTPRPIHNSHTKNANCEYDRSNGNNAISRDNPSLSIPLVDKNVRVYKNINEYDIIELKISASFNNKYICRYIGIHSGMTLYNIHRCICICLGVKKEDTDNYLHVFILNNGNIYGSGKKCSVSIIRKIQINTDRHITFKHIVKTPLYLYKAKDASKNHFCNDFPVNCANTLDDKACVNGGSQYGGESNPNEGMHSENESSQNSGGPNENKPNEKSPHEKIPHENIPYGRSPDESSPNNSDQRIGNANLYNPDPHSRNLGANVNVMDISNFGQSKNGQTFVESNAMLNYDMLNSVDTVAEMNHCNVSIPTLGTIGKAKKFSNLSNSSSSFYSHLDSNTPYNLSDNISNKGKSISRESLNRVACNRIMRFSHSSELSATAVGEYLPKDAGANINSGHSNGGSANQNCPYDPSENNINVSNFPIQRKNMKTKEASNNFHLNEAPNDWHLNGSSDNSHLNEYHSDLQLQKDGQKVSDNNDCDVNGPPSSENYAREDAQGIEDATAEDDYKRAKCKKGPYHENWNDQNGRHMNRKNDNPFLSNESTYANTTHADDHPLNKPREEAHKVLSPNTGRDTCYLYMNSQEENPSCMFNTISRDGSPYKHAMSAISPTKSDHPFGASNNYTFSAQQNDAHSYHLNGMKTSEQHEFENEHLKSNYLYSINVSPQFSGHMKFNPALSMHNLDEKNGVQNGVQDGAQNGAKGEAQTGQIMDDSDYPTIDSNCRDDGPSSRFFFPTSALPDYPYNLNGLNTPNCFFYKHEKHLTVNSNNSPTAYSYNDPMYNQDNHIDYQNVMNNTFLERDFSHVSSPNWCIPSHHFPQSNNAPYTNGSTASSYMDNSFEASPLDNTFNPQQANHYWGDSKYQAVESSKTCKNKHHLEISERTKNIDAAECCDATAARDNAMINIPQNGDGSVTKNYPPSGNYNSTSITHLRTHLNRKMENQENHPEVLKETTEDLGKETPQNCVQPDTLQRHSSGSTTEEGEPKGTKESAAKDCINREDSRRENPPLEDAKSYKGVQCGSLPECTKNQNDAPRSKDQMNHRENIRTNRAAYHNDPEGLKEGQLKEQIQKMKDSPLVEGIKNRNTQKESESSQDIINSDREEEPGDFINSNDTGERKPSATLSSHSKDDENAKRGGTSNPPTCNAVYEGKFGDATPAQVIHQEISTKGKFPEIENSHICNISNTYDDAKDSTPVRTEQNEDSNFYNNFKDTERGKSGHKSHQQVGCNHTGKSHPQKKDRNEQDYSYLQNGEYTSQGTHLVCEQNGSNFPPITLVQRENIKNGSTYQHTHGGETNLQGKTEVLRTSTENSTSRELLHFRKLNGKNATTCADGPICTDGSTCTDVPSRGRSTKEPILGGEKMESKEQHKNSTIDKKENYERDIKQGTQIILRNDHFHQDNEGSHPFTSEQRGDIPPNGLTETEQLILEYHPHLNEELNSEEDFPPLNEQNTYLQHIKKMVLITPHESSSCVTTNIPTGPMHATELSELEREDKSNLCLHQNAKTDCKQWEHNLYKEHFYTNNKMNYLEGNITPCCSSSPMTGGNAIPKDFTDNFHKTDLLADYDPNSKCTNEMVNKNQYSLNVENKNSAYPMTSLSFKKDLSNTTCMQVENAENDHGNNDHNPYYMSMVSMNNQNVIDFFSQGKRDANNGSLHTTSNTLMTVDTAVDTTDYMHSIEHSMQQSNPQGSSNNTQHSFQHRSQHGEQRGSQRGTQRRDQWSKSLNTNLGAEGKTTYFTHFNSPERVNENYQRTYYNIMPSEKALPEQPPFYVGSNYLHKEAHHSKFTSSLGEGQKEKIVQRNNFQLDKSRRGRNIRMGPNKQCVNHGDGEITHSNENVCPDPASAMASSHASTTGEGVNCSTPPAMHAPHTNYTNHTNCEDEFSVQRNLQYDHRDLCGSQKPRYHPLYCQSDNLINNYSDYSGDASTYMMNSNANDYSTPFSVGSLRNADNNVIKEETYYGSVNQGGYLHMNEAGRHSTTVGTFMHVDGMKQRGCATTHEMASNDYVQIMPHEENINSKHLRDDNLTIEECINSAYAKGGNERGAQQKERSSEQKERRNEQRERSSEQSEKASEQSERDSEKSERTFEENKSSFSMLYLFGKVKFNISIIDIIHDKTNSHDLLWVPRCCNGSYGTFLKNNYLNANEIEKHVPEEHIDIDCINLKLMETRFSKNVASSRTTKRKRMIDIDKTVLHFYKEHISEFFNNKNKIIRLTKKLCKYKKKRKYNSSDNGKSTAKGASKATSKGTSKSNGKRDEENNAHPYEESRCVSSKTASKTKYKGKRKVSRQASLGEDAKVDPSMDGENGADRSQENEETCDHLNDADCSHQNDAPNESDTYAQRYAPNYADHQAKPNYYHQRRDDNRDYYHCRTPDEFSANQMHAVNAAQQNYLFNEHVNRNVNKMAIQNDLLQNGQTFNDPFVNNMLGDMSTRNVSRNDFFPNMMYHHFSEQSDVFSTHHQHNQHQHNQHQHNQHQINPHQHEMGTYTNLREKGSPNGTPLSSLPPTTYYNQPTSQYFFNNNPNTFKSNFANNSSRRKGKDQTKSQMSSFNANNADTKSALNLSQILEGNNNFINISNTFINTNFAKELHQTNDLLVNQNNFDLNVMSGGLNAKQFTQ
ncbi:hypothetical protein C922_02461 [Plasmodium inui San Antonio 1]|uniref:Uncharacterized protein n=1 Tax=Plasmodium inui San Antonio 1 TaxID=1237626 RepID=W7API4_9APIC|nr:hypothetical protein C922_02461 [Plasmodium inui San Antonio 1]EUD67311.1 hypothetical protein C922_02461 [Plasmodium inui San Antonio 1]